MPFHILHSLLSLHYSKHQQCTAKPFTNERCKHGSHAWPRGDGAREQDRPARKGDVVMHLALGVFR